MKNKSIDRVKAGADIVRQALSAGKYMSAHLNGLALDIQTITLTYNEAKTLTDLTRSIQNVRDAHWENVEDNTSANNKRRKGTTIDGEHLHIRFSNTKGE